MWRSPGKTGSKSVDQETSSQVRHDEESRIRVDLELANQGMIGLGSDQLVQHLHCRRTENAQILLAGLSSDDFRRERLPSSTVADQDDVRALFDKVQVEQMQDLAFHLLPGLMVIEVERLDSVLRLQLG